MQEEQKQLARALIIFLMGVMIVLLVFFAADRKMIERNANYMISLNTERQGHLLNMILENHYGYLEALACELAEEEDIKSEKNRELIEKVRIHSDLSYLLIADQTGIGIYSDGRKASIRERRYFREAVSGKNTLSDPVISKLDGGNRVVLGVPIYKEEKVVGVLGGSIDANDLSALLFRDVYDGKGISLLATKEGALIACSNTEWYQKLGTKGDIFSQFSSFEILTEDSWEDIREDFDQQRSGTVKIWKQRELKWYLNYRPINRNGWVMCYLVPEAVAKQNYAFIGRHESYLTVAMILLSVCFLTELLRISARHQKKLLRAAQTDALTQTANKIATEMQINEWLKQNGGDGLHAFLMLDIDKFKEINDTYGHYNGDELLMQVGMRLKKHFRSDDIVGRIGGDEFVVFMKNVGSREHAVNRVEELLRMIREIRVEETDLSITSSMGLAFSPEHGKTYLELYKAADAALYQQKARGRNGYVMLE